MHYLWEIADNSDLKTMAQALHDCIDWGKIVRDEKTKAVAAFAMNNVNTMTIMNSKCCKIQQCYIVNIHNY